MRILIAGDAHGSISAWEYWVKAALRFDADVIFQVGDNLLMDDVVPYLNRISNLLDKARLTGYQIDGNHDNFDLLMSYQKASLPGLREVRKNFFYVERGTVVSFDGVNFMGLGGAYSTDREARDKQTENDGVLRWWDTEELTREQAAYAMAQAKRWKVDVMITHDFPHGVDFAKQKVLTYNLEAMNQRKLIRRVVAVAKPNILFHGHHHRRYNDRLLIDNHEVTIQGLADHLRYQDSYVVMDTEEYRTIMDVSDEAAALTREGV